MIQIVKNFKQHLYYIIPCFLILLSFSGTKAEDNHRRALITGVTGQDGSYLADFLLEKGYEVYGLIRHSSTPNTERITHLLDNKNFKLYKADLTDGNRILDIIRKVKPQEVYNLAAQSHVGISFEMPESTAHVDALGPLFILDAIRHAGLENYTKFYQASTSELYGKVQEIPQSESTPFYPRSPYGVAKLYAYWITVNYREAYNMFACNGILFNHESPRRGKDFVTRKITLAVARLKNSKKEDSCQTLKLGNLDAKRDWGHARDYVEGMWKILQQNVPGDYVLATGHTHSVREFVEAAFEEIGIKIMWHGTGINEKGVNSLTGQVLVEIDPQFFRPAEVDLLIGDATKAYKELQWNPRVTLKELVKEMVAADIELIKSGK